MMALKNIHDYLAEKAGEMQIIVAALDKDRGRYRRDRVSVLMDEEVGALFDLIDQKYKPAKQAYKSFKLIPGVDKGTADDVREQATKIYVQRRLAEDDGQRSGRGGSREGGWHGVLERGCWRRSG
jgi:hypothetical protein